MLIYVYTYICIFLKFLLQLNVSGSRGYLSTANLIAGGITFILGFSTKKEKKETI
jgi:hypothetical protein